MFVFVLCGCKNQYEDIPLVNVNIYINIQSPDYQNLSGLGSWSYIEGGSKGIIVFNGMIYNFLEIRKKLIKKKIKFRTKSDTEVLLKFLNYYGIKNLNMLDGMWSFAYYNFSEKNLYLCRDRFGEKPLFFCKHRNNLIFGSYFDYILKLYDKKKFKLNFNKVENFIKNSWKSTNSDHSNPENPSPFLNVWETPER